MKKTITSTKVQPKKNKLSKSKLASKLNSILRKSSLQMIKEIENALKQNDVWYSKDDSIVSYDGMHKPNDRNGDQLFLDHVTSTLDQMFEMVKPEYLWTNTDISKNKEN